MTCFKVWNERNEAELISVSCNHCFEQHAYSAVSGVVVFPCISVLVTVVEEHVCVGGGINTLKLLTGEHNTTADRSWFCLQYHLEALNFIRALFC